MVWGYGSDAGNIYRLGPFLKSRMTRIYPTYWAVFVLTVLYYCIRPGVGDPSLLETKALIRGVALYGMGPWQIPPSGTLPFELALYICFGALFIVGRTLFCVAGALWCVAIVAQWYGWYTVGNYPILLSPSMLEFFLGAVGAVFIRRYRPRGSGIWLGIAAVLCVVVGVIGSVEQAQGYSHSFRNFALPYLLLIIAGVSYELSGQRRYPRLLMLLGDASFSIYLTHYYLIWELNGKMSQYGLIASTIGYDGQRIVILVLVLAIGVGFWAVVERPLLKWLHGKSTRAVDRAMLPPLVERVRM